MEDGPDGRDPGWRMSPRNEHVHRLVLPALQARERQSRTSSQRRARTRGQHRSPFTLLLSERTVVKNDRDAAKAGPTPGPDLGLHRVAVDAGPTQLAAAHDLILRGCEIAKTRIHDGSLPLFAAAEFASSTGDASATTSGSYTTP